MKKNIDMVMEISDYLENNNSCSVQVRSVDNGIAKKIYDSHLTAASVDDFILSCGVSVHVDTTREIYVCCSYRLLINWYCFRWRVALR